MHGSTLNGESAAFLPNSGQAGVSMDRTCATLRLAYYLACIHLFISSFHVAGAVRAGFHEGEAAADKNKNMNDDNNEQEKKTKKK